MNLQYTKMALPSSITEANLPATGEIVQTPDGTFRFFIIVVIEPVYV